MPSFRVIRALLVTAGVIGSSAGVLGAAATFGPPDAVVPAAAAATAVAWQDPSRPASAVDAASASAARSTVGAVDRAQRSAGPRPAAPAPDPAASSSAAGSTASSGAPIDAAAGTPTTSPAGPAGNGSIYIGSVGGGYQQAVAGTGVALADHAYAFFTSKVPQAHMITVSAANTKWRDVAAAGPGSALYAQIVNWAQTIKARGGTVMVAYNHEPEGHDRLLLGSATDFIAAYRHVESIFDQQGATNVMWTWQMTAYAFRTSPASDQYADRWYPGDQWVDNVGADAYNWYTCGANASGQYVEMKALGDPVLAFARAHGKLASFPEFASHANPNRTQWLDNAHAYFVQNQDILTAAFYFNRPPTVAANADCQWGLTSSSEYGGLRRMAQDTAHFAV
jgi:Glycosyl hydrolase family 26